MVKLLGYLAQNQDAQSEVIKIREKVTEIDFWIFFLHFRGCVYKYFRADFHVLSGIPRLLNWGMVEIWSILALTDMRDPQSRSPSPPKGSQKRFSKVSLGNMYRGGLFKDSRYFKKSYKINQNGYGKLRPANRKISTERISEKYVKNISGSGKY